MQTDLGDLANARALLEVGPGADRNEIVHAYRRLAQRHHPDLGGDAETMSNLNRAVGALLDSLIANSDGDHVIDPPAAFYEDIFDDEVHFTLGRSLLTFLVVPTLLVVLVMFAVAQLT